MQRRSFLKLGVLSGGATALYGLAGCTSLQKGELREPAQAGRWVTRREASDPLAKKDLDIYKHAVEMMRKNPAVLTNAQGASVPSGLSWTAQADIHQNFCPHGTWNFFPWHREYLYRFEEIIREVTGEESFALPYWDWSKNQKLPQAFSIAGTSLFLNEAQRIRDFSTQLKTVCHPDRIQAAISTKDFESFMGSVKASGPIEYGPHNTVHMAIGGTMGTFKSPLDPIFWLHHCNVDRIWAEWQEANDFFQSEEPIHNYKDWLNLKLPGFYDRKGLQIASPRTAEVVIDPKQLGYLYDTSKRTEATKAAFFPPKPSTRRVIAETEKIQAATTLYDRNPSQLLVTLEDLPEDVLLIFDNYLENPSEYEDYLVNLQVINIPEIPAGVRMVINLLIDRQKTFVLNYTPFASPQHHHADDPTTLNVDYNKVLNEVLLKFYGRYPRHSEFVVEFYNQDNSVYAIKNLAAIRLAYKMTLLGPKS